MRNSLRVNRAIAATVASTRSVLAKIKDKEEPPYSSRSILRGFAEQRENGAAVPVAERVTAYASS
jgi:hypothetical protein